MVASIGELSVEIARIQEKIVGDIGGKCPLDKASLLAWLIARYNLRTTVEIGVYRGASFLPQLLAHSRYTGGTGYGIDPYSNEEATQNDLPPSIKETVTEFIDTLDFEQIYQELLALIKELEYERYSTVLKETSERAISYFAEKEIFFDFLHIDGNHDTDHVLLDVELYLPRVKKKGFIVLDDIGWSSVEPAYRLVASKCTLLFKRVETFSSWAVFYNETDIEAESERELKTEIECAHEEILQFQELLFKVREQVAPLQQNLSESQRQLEQTREQLSESQGQLEQTREQLSESQGQLKQTREQLSESQGQLKQALGQLEQTRGKIEQTREQLSESQGQLEQTREQLEQVRGELRAHQTALIQARELIRAMEKSKFWQLRARWFRLRQLLGLDDHKDVGISLAIVNKLENQFARMSFEIGDRLASFSTDRIIILDDIFPHLLSAFRIAEYNTYLEKYPNAVVYSTGDSFKYLNDSRSFAEVLQEYLQYYPQFKNRVFEYNSERVLRAKLVYLVFLNNAFRFIDIIEKYNIPFVFTLYPGGGFIPDEEESDRKLFRVCSSKNFQKVIVTQKYIGDYLIDKKICTAEQVELIFGVVTSIENILPENFEKKYYKINKETFDICFVAHKYMVQGLNKGYDVFIETAKNLYRLHGNKFVFHVVGNFDETDIEVEELKENIRFYGTRTTDWFPRFYAEMDIILSPNIPLHFLLPEVKKSFIDGFPTGCCVEAGFCGTVVFCTDTVHQNIAFKNGEDIVIIDRDIDAICKSITRYYYNPYALYELSRNGQKTFQKIFKLDNQMESRLKIVSEVLSKG